MPNGQLPIFSKEELDAATKPKEANPTAPEKSLLGLSKEEIENVYNDNDEGREKYWWKNR